MTLTELTPMELNQYRFSGDRTPLTPEQIEANEKASQDAKVSAVTSNIDSQAGA